MPSPSVFAVDDGAAVVAHGGAQRVVEGAGFLAEGGVAHAFGEGGGVGDVGEEDDGGAGGYRRRWLGAGALVIAEEARDRGATAQAVDRRSPLERLRARASAWKPRAVRCQSSTSSRMGRRRKRHERRTARTAASTSRDVPSADIAKLTANISVDEALIAIGLVAPRRLSAESIEQDKQRPRCASRPQNRQR